MTTGLDFEQKLCISLLVRWFLFFFFFWPCHIAYGIFVPWTRTQTNTPALEAQRALTTGAPGKSPPVKSPRCRVPLATSASCHSDCVSMCCDGFYHCGLLSGQDEQSPTASSPWTQSMSQSDLGPERASGDHLLPQNNQVYPD